MFPVVAGHILLGVIVAISIALMLVRPRGIAEVYWIGGGLLLLLALGLISLPKAGRAAAQGSDVYLFLFGMMLLSDLAREQGVFDWLASAAVRKAKGSCSRLFLLVYAVGTVVTIFMSNDATAVVLTPAILFAVRRAKVQTLPYLFACAFIANAASFVLPISNPANLVVFQNHMPPLGQWLQSFGVPSALSIVITFVVLRWIFRRQISGVIECPAENHFLTHNGRLVVAALCATVAVLLAASALNWNLGLPTCVTAVAITAVVSVRTRTNPLALLREISWSTLALVAGLFIMVDAVESIGAITYTQHWLAWANSLAPSLGALVTGFGVGVSNNLVNNLPLGLIAATTLRAAQVRTGIANAALIGTDLGPNLSITGSLATILWLIALRREKLNVSFWDFFKIGAIAMPTALAASLAGSIAIGALLRTH